MAKMPLGGWPVGKPVGCFLGSGLMWGGPAYYMWCQPWVGGPRMHKEAGRTSHQDQATRPSLSYPS